jgi:molybdopterin-guanine dinucleotide biosynthesis protein A
MKKAKTLKNQYYFDMPLVILCGGKSSRMGEDKSLLPFGKSASLVQYQYERLIPYFKEVYLSSKINKFDFLNTTDNIIFDDGETFSPMVALQSILQHIETPYVFILTVDTPFVTLDTINSLISSCEKYDINVAKTQKLHNLCGVFNKSVLSFVNELISKDIHKIGLLLDNCHTNIIKFDDENEFLNLNKKEDYLKALRVIS